MDMNQLPDLSRLMEDPNVDPEQLGARFWYEHYFEQRAENQQLCHQLSQLQQELDQLKEALRKVAHRNSENSSQPPSANPHKKKNKDIQRPKRKQGPKYGHPGTTRNGFGFVDERIKLALEACPECSSLGITESDAPLRKHQVAELVDKLVEVREYQRPQYSCPDCGWQGYAPLPLGCREDFSYGSLLSSLVGWLGYGGHLSWAKQRYLVETVLAIPLSQGSLSKMHQWFCESLYPSYEQWWEIIQQPGVRCVDETSYRLNGVNYWLWVATSEEVCVMFLAPTRSSKEVESLLSGNFEGILSSDCWSAYSPQAAQAKQKCLAHIGRELEELASSRFTENQKFAEEVKGVINRARQVYEDYHKGKVSLTQLQNHRLIAEAELTKVIEDAPEKGWPYDAQNLSNRFRRHWEEWFTFLSHPEVKPDNNDAERALRPVVLHRKMSGGSRSHWGGQLISMMYSFLETMRLQGKNAVEELCCRLEQMGRWPPELQEI